VGLSSSFLEPLEATSIHGTIVQMLMFTGGFLKDATQATDKVRDDFNSRVARQVDDFRTFINMHYVSEREDTPFWRFVRNESIHAETGARLERWRHEMPRREHFPHFLGGLPHVEAQLHYPVLDGLGLLDRRVAKAEMVEVPAVRAFARKSADSLVKEYKHASSKALGHAAYLTLARETS
jgi:tryptophan halogenase